MCGFAAIAEVALAEIPGTLAGAVIQVLLPQIVT
jgi:hypothetical protein